MDTSNQLKEENIEDKADKVEENQKKTESEEEIFQKKSATKENLKKSKTAQETRQTSQDNSRVEESEEKTKDLNENVNKQSRVEEIAQKSKNDEEVEDKLTKEKSVEKSENENSNLEVIPTEKLWEDIKPAGNEDSLVKKSTLSNSDESCKLHQSNEVKSETDRSQYIHYEGDVAVYTDPQTRQQYTWDKEANEWKQRKIDYDYDGTHYFYTDNKTGVKYKWDVTSNSWIKPENPTDIKTKTSHSDEDEEEYDECNAQKTAQPIKKQDMSKGTYGYEGDTHIYTDATDGTVYIWDKEKNAWFPKVDDDFIARYQMNYGFIEQPQTEEPAKTEKKPEEKLESTSTSNIVEEKPAPKRKAEPPKWFDVGDESTKVYVSNLPLDMKQDEFADLMQKCGLIMKDIDTNQMKIKLYTDPVSKEFKGDALCTYIKKESVPLALNIIDGYLLRGKKIKVERAKFTMKGESYDPNLKPKKRRKKDLEKLKKMQEKLLDWRPDKMRGERSKNESVIVVKNLFDPIIFDKDVTLILEYQQDLREEASKCGHVKKVVLFDKHPEGVAQIFFKEAEAADACKELLNNRWFGQRQITAETWDGKSRYKINETAEEKEARLKKWETFLEEEDKKQKQQQQKESTCVEEEAKDKDGPDSDGTKSSGESEVDEEKG